MTKRDFFKIIIKLFGLYSLVLSVFTLIPQNVSNLLFIGESPEVIIWIVGILFVTVAIFMLILTKTDGIINMLKLDKNFDDDRIEIGNLNNESIFKFAIILIGGFLIVDNISHFLVFLIDAFKAKASQLSYVPTNRPMDFSVWGIYVFNLVVGYLLIANCKRLAQSLNRD